MRLEDFLSLSDDELIAILKNADAADREILNYHLALANRTEELRNYAFEVTILGSKGCRFGMLTGQVGGIWLKSSKMDIIIDPGPSLTEIVSQLVKMGKDYHLEQLDAILCSHLHPDHTTDLIPTIEGMTIGMSQNKGMLIGNRTTIESYLAFDRYHMSRVKPVILALDNKSLLDIDFDGVKITSKIQLEELEIVATPTWHFETANSPTTGIGFLIHTPFGSIWYTSDTTLFDGLLETIKELCGSRKLLLVIANADASVIDSDPEKKTASHLLTRDVVKIANTLQPHCIVIHHYDEAYAQLDYRLAQAIYLNRHIEKDEIPVKVLPSEDGLCLRIHLDGSIEASNMGVSEKTELVTEYADRIFQSSKAN